MPDYQQQHQYQKNRRSIDPLCDLWQLLPCMVLHILSNLVEVLNNCEVPLLCCSWNVLHNQNKQRQNRAGQNYTDADLLTFFTLYEHHCANLNAAVWFDRAAMSDEQLWYDTS